MVWTDAAMAVSVSEQRQEEDLRRQATQFAHRFETHPWFTLVPVGLPLGLMRPHQRSVTATAANATAGERCPQLDVVHMYGRPGKVGQAADVIEVEVGLHDVPHVAWVEAQLADLVDGG